MRIRARLDVVDAGRFDRLLAARQLDTVTIVHLVFGVQTIVLQKGGMRIQTNP